MDVSFASAPPSVGNMAVGFDILGHALSAPGDQICAIRTNESGVKMGTVTGVVSSLPDDASRNTAGRAAQALLEFAQAQFGVELKLHKGIALGSGMGGSAASAVAAVLAVNQLLPKPLPLAHLLSFALEGEKVASGAVHADNVAPCLLGGIVFVPPSKPERYVQIPAPAGLSCVLVRPEIRLDTSSGRQLLSEHCALSDVITQTSHLAAFICACYENDIDALAGVLRDVLVEPQRASQVPGFDDIQRAALDAGALGFSLSGSGPSMIAWCREGDRERIRTAVETTAGNYHENFQLVMSRLDAPGAKIITAEEWSGA